MLPQERGAWGLEGEDSVELSRRHSWKYTVKDGNCLWGCEWQTALWLEPTDLCPALRLVKTASWQTAEQSRAMMDGEALEGGCHLGECDSGGVIDGLTGTDSQKSKFLQKGGSTLSGATCSCMQEFLMNRLLFARFFCVRRFKLFNLDGVTYSFCQVLSVTYPERHEWMSSISALILLLAFIWTESRPAIICHNLNIC